jgi:uncharacterized protein (TIGR02996 family)
MSELHSLIRACKAEPDDDAPRLILSDWLEEHVEEIRVKFVRRQLRQDVLSEPAIEPNPEWFGEWRHFANEERKSRFSYADAYSFRFERGFIRLRDDYRELYDGLDEILSPAFDWTWLEEITFGSWHDGDWTPLFQSPRLLELNRLELIDDGYRSNLLRPLAASPYVINLKHLRLVCVNRIKKDIARLSDCRELAGLRSLVLDEMDLVLSDAKAIAASEVWDRLRKLSIRGARIGDAGLIALAAGRHRPLLSELGLLFGSYSDDGLIFLARTDRFPALQSLAIGWRTFPGDKDDGKFGRHGIEALLNS